jgi:cyclopropane fatty-acyl-phospholipid synthase-like methyltransferase
LSYYDHKRNVEKYIAMMSGFDNSALIEAVFDNLPSGKRMLELGMGGGQDLTLLKKAYTVTGSDTSKAFLDAYRKHDPLTPLLRLDAANIATEETFDYIYSNKVLIHLTDEALKASFQHQSARLADDGLVFHTFLFGQGQEHHHGLLFKRQTPETVAKAAEAWFSPVREVRYTEMTPDDSFYMVLKKK